MTEVFSDTIARLVQRASDLEAQITESTGYTGQEALGNLGNTKDELLAFFPDKVESLYKSGHFSEAIFEGCKYFESTLRNLSGLKQRYGSTLAFEVFDKSKPKLKVNPLNDQSEKDEQEGVRFIAAGILMAYKNPRSHEHSVESTEYEVFLILSLVKHLLEKINS